MLSVAEIMTTKPHALGPNDRPAQARKLMSEHQICHIPILDEKKVLEQSEADATTDDFDAGFNDAEI